MEQTKREYSVITFRKDVSDKISFAINKYMNETFTEPRFKIKDYGFAEGLTVEYESDLDLNKIFNDISQQYLTKEVNLDYMDKIPKHMLNQME